MTPEPSESVTVITLRAMKFDALVGILPQEREDPQPIEVDLFLEVESPSGTIDTHNILDYRHAYAMVSGVVTSRHIPYLEQAADEIAALALDLPFVLSVKVAVRKMKVALPGPLAFAEVAIERSRE